jgi:disulfide bond formation protein DsbB
MRAALRRLGNVTGVLICAGLLGFAVYAQFDLHLDPCPLCIFQRIGIAALGLVFLAAAVHHPRRWGMRVYALLIVLVALATAGVAVRQIYLQHLPPGSVPSCGAPLSVMLQFMPVTSVIRKVLDGSGECSIVNWRFLGLAMSEWVLLWALALGLFGAGVNWRLGRVK